VLEVRTRRTHYRRTAEEWRRRLRQHEAVIRERWGARVFEDYDRYLSITIRSFEDETQYQSLAQYSLRRIDS
jgi:cyclopropane-fatty-acyl-phospholipid synthase